MRYKLVFIGILIFICQNVYLQNNDDQTGFKSDTIIKSYDFISDDDILKYIQTCDTNGSGYLFGGQIRSIFREKIDSVAIEVSYADRKYIYFTNTDGLFNIPVYSDEKSILVDINVTKPSYHSFDTSIILRRKSDIPVFRIALFPKYKILLRGRIFAGNLPLEGVNVTIRHNEQIIRTKTLGCYYDSENYWNCLFNGMFKTEITAENPMDSIYLSFSKTGYKLDNLSMQFKEYDGNILHYKLRYADTLAWFPKHNLNLQLAFPVWLDNDWYVGLKYYYMFRLGNFRRLGLGIETALLISQLELEFPTFQGAEMARIDSFYYTPYLGPTVLIWLTNPVARKFSSYCGNSFNVNLNNGNLSFQPFIGSRYFLDMNKSLGIELRYVSTQLDKVNYTFNPYGNAIPSTNTIIREKIVISIGMQIIL